MAVSMTNAGDVRHDSQFASRANPIAVAETVLAAARAVPRGNYEYSNMGYLVVGAALQLATVKSGEALMEDELSAPLGMASCGFGPLDTTGDLSRRLTRSGFRGEHAPMTLKDRRVHQTALRRYAPSSPPHPRPSARRNMAHRGIA